VRRAILVPVAAAFLLGIAAQWRGASNVGNADVHGRRYDGVIVEQTATADVDRFVVRLDDGRRVTATLPAAGLDVGTRVDVRARFEPPDDARNPGEPSPREFAIERGIAGRLAHPHLLAATPADARDPALWLPLARAWAGARLRERLAEPFATILAGALWGERGALPPDLRAEFQDTGTVHILVTAGLHLGVVAALAVWLIGACGGGRVGGSLGAIVVVWLYAIFSGGHLPSLRAATMASFFLLARATGRSAFSWNALAAAAVAVVAIRPASLGTLSFALSFSCVGAILLFAKPLAAALERLGVPELAREALALTIATQAGTWPLTAAAFLVFAPYAMLANALVVPVVGAAMLVGFAELAATPIPFIAAMCANVETSLLMWIVAVVRFAANLPGAHVVMTPPPVWTIVLYDTTLLAVAWLLSAESAPQTLLARVRYLVAAAIFAGACALCIWPPRTASHDLIITAIDVGQADALLIQTPRGHAYLVDAGGRLERGALTGSGSPAEAIGERIVVPFLIRRGIHHLDAIILSHPHGDHVGGFAPVLRVLGADIFADGGQSYPGHAYHDALDVVREQHVRVITPRDGDVWSTDDGLTFRFYGPSEPFISGSRNDINENSIVFMLDYHDPKCKDLRAAPCSRFRMLFTGDAGAVKESRLLEEGVDLHADVLKVGHHGSAYGTTPNFVRAVSPKIAINSVGRDNLFGHPAPETLATLERASARIYRTDENGAITVSTDGTATRISSMF
jgi:competence protein ComEC